MPSGLPKVGVEAVVEGVEQFTSSFNRMGTSMNSLGGIIGGVISVASGFAQVLTGVAGAAIGLATGAFPLVISGFAGIVMGGQKAIEGFLQLASVVGTVLFNAFRSFINLVLSPFVAAWKTLVDVVKGALSVFAGISLSNLFQGISQGIRGLIGDAFDAAGAFQTLEIRLQGLLALQISQGTTIQEEITTINDLSAAQQLRVMELNRVYGQQTRELEQLASAYNKTASAMGEDSVAALQLEARMDELKQSITGTAGELQTLEGLKVATTLKDITTGTMSFADALGAAVPRAKALFDWVSRIGILTPFTVEEVANVFTLATSYGFAEDKAKDLTQAVIDFSSGMGLSGETTERIIQNLGQMVQAGKITGTELRDLARGAFVPVNDILALTAKNMGITVEQLNKLRASGQAKPGPFIEAFIQFATESFPNAAARMARTLPGVIGNIKDLVQTVVGMRVIKPVLDSVTGTVADFLEALLGGTLGNLAPGLKNVPTTLGTIADRLGLALKSIADGFLSTLPSIEEAVQGLLFALDKVVTSIEFLAAGNVRDALRNLGVPQSAIDTVMHLLGAFQALMDFWTENGDAIKQAIGDALSEILGLLGIDVGTLTSDWASAFEDFATNLDLSTVTGAIEGIKEGIQGAIDLLFGKGETGDETIFERIAPNIDTLQIAFHKLGIALGILMTAIGADASGGKSGAKGGLVGFFIGLAAAGIDTTANFIANVAIAIAALKLAVEGIGALLEPIITFFSTFTAMTQASGGNAGSGLILTIATMFAEIGTSFDTESVKILEKQAVLSEGIKASWITLHEELIGKSIIPEMWLAIIGEFMTSGDTLLGEVVVILGLVKQAFTNAASSIVSTFASAGTRAMTGFVRGFVTAWASNKDDFEEAIDEIIEFIQDKLQISSPSKLFAKMGSQMMMGMAAGVERGVPLVKAAMETVMTALPGSASAPFTGGSTTNNTVNYNVSMQSQNNFPTPFAPQDDLSATLALLRSF